MERSSEAEKRLDVVCNDAEYWKTAFYDLIHKRGSYVNDLQRRNEQQAAKIMELEALLSCLRRVGDGVHVDHQRLMELYRFYPDKKGRGMLSNSKYARK